MRTLCVAGGVSAAHALAGRQVDGEVLAQVLHGRLDGDPRCPFAAARLVVVAGCPAIFRRVFTRVSILAAYLDDPGLPEADRLRVEAWGERSCLLVPLIFRGEVSGCLQLIERRHQHLFSARNRELAATLAALAAVAIQNARLHGELEALAISDGVTGLYNHRFFHERLAAEVIRAQRYGLPLLLLMIDTDGFKAYNDRHGHPAGDAHLRALGVLLRSHTRAKIDIVAAMAAMSLPGRCPAPEHAVQARSGSACEMPLASDALSMVRSLRRRARQWIPGRAESGDSYAVAAAERIRSDVAAEGFGSKEPPPVITVSIGVASLAEHADSLEGLIESADKALYRAKQLGKNPFFELADVRPAQLATLASPVPPPRRADP